MMVHCKVLVLLVVLFLLTVSLGFAIPKDSKLDRSFDRVSMSIVNNIAFNCHPSPAASER